MIRRYTTAVLLVAGLVACDSYEDDVRTICEAPNDVAVEPADDPSVRATKLAKHIDGRLKTDGGKKLFESFASLAPAQRHAALESAAEQAGVTPCPYLGTLAPRPSPP